MTSERWALAAILGLSCGGMAGAVLWSLRDDAAPSAGSKRERAPAPARPPDERRSSAATEPVAAPGEPEPQAAQTERLVRRLLDLLGRAQPDEAEELAWIQRELLALGEHAGLPLLAHLEKEGDPARRDLLLDFLRKIPGRAVEARLIEQARTASRATTRSIAMDALAERRSDAALQALGEIAQTDPEMPLYPLVTSHRRGADELSTELPDEINYTPRMKAMLALASTGDERVVPTLLRILTREPDESLRMRAAEHLSGFHTTSSVRDALRAAARLDASRYVRLAALRALDGSGDPAFVELLVEVTERDPDGGVRLLAARLLAELGKPDP